MVKKKIRCSHSNGSYRLNAWNTPFVVGGEIIFICASEQRRPEFICNITNEQARGKRYIPQLLQCLVRMLFIFLVYLIIPIGLFEKVAYRENTIQHSGKRLNAEGLTHFCHI